MDANGLLAQLKTLLVDWYSDSSTVISIGTTVCMVGSDESLNLNYGVRYEYRYVQYLLRCYV